MIRGFIFDFSGTVYDKRSGDFVEGAKEALEYLFRRYPLALISKSGGRKKRTLISSLGLDRYFMSVLVVDEKRSADFLKCASVMGVLPENIAVVGDKVTSEIRIGNLLGMKTIWLKRGKYAGLFPSSKDEEPDVIITDLLQLKDMF